MVTPENFISSRMDRSHPSNGLFFFRPKTISAKEKDKSTKTICFLFFSFLPRRSFFSFVSVIFELLTRKKTCLWTLFHLNDKKFRYVKKSARYTDEKTIASQESTSIIHVSSKVKKPILWNAQNKEKRATLNLATKHFTTNYVWKKSRLIQSLNQRSSLLGSTTQTKALRKDLVPKYLLL